MTLSQEIILRRLAFAKYLMEKGNEESKKTEPLSSVAILNYHDAIELVFNLILEDNGVSSNNLSFMGCFEEINRIQESKGKEKIGLKASLEKLKDIRKNFKHKGILPSNSDINESKFSSNMIFEELCTKTYNIKPSEISLVDLIVNEKVRDYLNKAKESYPQNKNEAIKNLSLAFEFLLRNYESSKTSRFGKSPFFFGKDMTFLDSFSIGDKTIGRNMTEFIDKVKESIESMQKAVKILAFGLNYRKYVKFSLMIPEPLKVLGSTEPIMNLPKEEMPLSQDDFDFCLNYVIECAFKLQEFDFEVSKKNNDA